MDFSTLSDEQLLELIESAMSEAVSRGVGRIAETIYLDAQESARIQSEAAEAAKEKLRIAEVERLKREAESKVAAEARAKTTESQTNTWAKKAALMQALKAHPLFEDDKDFSVNIWERSPGGEVRIYIQGPKVGRRNSNEWEIVYYATGSRYNAPGSIEGLAGGDHEAQMKALCELAIKRWKPGFKVALGGVSGIEADSAALAEYKSVLGLGVAANV